MERQDRPDPETTPDPQAEDDTNTSGTPGAGATDPQEAEARDPGAAPGPAEQREEGAATGPTPDPATSGESSDGARAPAPIPAPGSPAAQSAATTTSTQDSDPAASAAAPERLCRKCSTVSTTAGDYCPHCGASYVRRRRLPRVSRRVGRVLAAVVLLLVLAGGATGIVLKGQADDRAERRERAQRNLARLEAQARKQREDAAAAEQAAADEAAAEDTRTQRRLRTFTVRELRKAVTKDARAKAADGLLEDRARSTQCENTDGNEDDLDEASAAYSCIAITDVDADGGSRGYRFTARVDFEEGSFTWHLGD